MAFPRLDIVDTDETTVLWSFNDQLGTVNPNSVKAKLGPVDFGISTEITTAEYLATGGQVSGYRDPVATATLTFYPAASTADARTTGLGVLNKLLERGGVMIWQPTSGSPLRYIDFLASPHVSVYQGQHVANLASVDEGVALRFLMQPYLRGALVTVGPTNVPNDPASGTPDLCRVFPITVTGDLPTPVSIRANMDSGSTVERVHIAHRAQGAEPASIMADYLSDSAFVQCESTPNRGWAIVHGFWLAAAADSNASPGGGGDTVARSSYTADAGVMAMKVRATRLTKVDSLRGSWDIWTRVKASAASKHWLQLRWGLADTTDPVDFTEKAVPHDVTNAPAFGYVELKLGRITVPYDVAVLCLRLEIWGRRESGTGTLDYDYIFLSPHEEQATVTVPPGVTAKTLGKELTSPPDEITSDPTWVAGAVVGNTIQLNANNEAAGWGPNAGTTLAVGRNHFTFTWSWDGAGAKNLKVRVANITDNTEAAVQTIPFATNETRSVTLRFDAVAGKTYQPQLGFTSYAGSGKVVVRSITHEFLPSITSTFSLRTEPGDRYSVDRLDPSGNLAGYLGVEGEIPAVLQPGLNHVTIRCDEIPLVGYSEGQNKLTRTPAVTLTYSPRYAL